MVEPQQQNSQSSLTQVQHISGLSDKWKSPAKKDPLTAKALSVHATTTQNDNSYVSNSIDDDEESCNNVYGSRIVGHFQHESGTRKAVSKQQSNRLEIFEEGEEENDFFVARQQSSFSGHGICFLVQILQGLGAFGYSRFSKF
jgi:hypothetical protein